MYIQQKKTLALAYLMMNYTWLPSNGTNDRINIQYVDGY